MIEDTAPLLLAALLLDAVFGEPKAIWSRIPHPAVAMGRLIAWCDLRFNRGFRRKRRGVVLIALLGVGALTLGAGIAALPFGWLWSILIAANLLAQKSLSQHVLAVADALRQSLPEGRAAVAMIVGRDTADLTGPEVARAAIESGAENLSDGVVAPAFWFLLLGLPGILFYKIVNTADSMIGHKTEDHIDFGWGAARLDDVLNWVPARLTAILISLMHPVRGAWRIAWRDARKHRSPNAGWPEAAMAGVLAMSLSGPRRYQGVLTEDPWINPTGRPEAGPVEIEAAAEALWRCWAATLGITLILSLL